MYPDRELIELARRKTALRQRMVAGRRHCAVAAVAVLRPVAWLDRAALCWRRLSPLARWAVGPLGVVVVRALLRRRRAVRTPLRWGPILLGIVRLGGAALGLFAKSSSR